MSSTVWNFCGLMYNGLNIAVRRIARYLLSCFASHVNIHPSILSALQPWVSLDFLNNQTPLLSVFPIHCCVFVTFKSATTSSIHPSQARSSFSSSYEQSSFHHLSRHCSCFHSLYLSQPSTVWAFINFTTSSPFMDLFNSPLFLILQVSPTWIGP